MKRFLMFLVIAIAVVSLGLTIYYFSTDNEVIYIKSSYLVVEVGDNIQTEGENGLLDFKHRSEHTTLTYSIEQEENEDASLNVLTFNEDANYYTAQNGGKSKIVINTNNPSYSKLVIDVLVCDGSAEYPYVLKTEEDLHKIGNDEEYTTSDSYKLGNDIELTQPWNPIGSYSGTFDGNYFTISNMQITDSTSITDAGFVSILEEKGVIKNLFLTNVNINVARKYVGTYAGTSKGLIQTSEATGTIVNSNSGETAFVGGIAGRTLYETKEAKIDRCGFEGTIESAGTKQVGGGIVGENNSATISETYFRGIVKNGESVFGGIVGHNDGSQYGSADIYDSYFYLTQTDERTKTERIGGITYENKNASATAKNMVTGCYFGGEIASSVPTDNTGDAYTSQANGYLTKEEFINKNEFITTIASNGGKNRTWDFNSVWEIPNDSKYPILNVFSSVGSVYVIDVSTIITGTDITTAQQLYDVMAGRVTEETYKIASDISLDPKDCGFVWGDSASDHAIPEIFDGQIINGTVKDTVNGQEIERPCKITGLTLRTETDGADVGMVKSLGANAVISGLVIDNVTIEAKTNNIDAKYVGVLAGTSKGASIYNVTITNVNVNVDGEAFGTIVGFAEDYSGHGIKNVTAKFVDTTHSYFVYAGGLTGINLGAITATTEIYSYAYDINLVANFAGGIAGANAGTIEYSTAQDVQFDREQDEVTINNLYSGNYNIFIGGIVGMNQYDTAKGNISNVYANINVLAQTGSKYYMYVGGIAGYNSNNIVRAYVKASNFNITGSHNVFVGGVTGYNTGKITNSVVDKDSSISTSIVASVGADNQNGKYLLNIDNCSTVGGIVGYDARTSTSTPSIFQSASYMKSIRGYYAGGIAGIARGKIEKSFCGESTKSNGGVTIEGYMVGGIASVIASGFVKDCYTFASLQSAKFSGTYKDLASVINMDVSAMGGIAVLVLNKDTIVQGCYTVVSFSGPGVRYGASANMEGYTHGTVKNCIYQTAGNKPSYGTQLSASKLRGNDSFSSFAKAIGSNLTVWNLDTSSEHYPTLEGVNVRFPSSDLPYFN